MLEARRPQASLHEPQAEKLKSSFMVTRVDKKLGKVVQMCTYIHVHTHTLNEPMSRTDISQKTEYQVCEELPNITN